MSRIHSVDVWRAELRLLNEIRNVLFAIGVPRNDNPINHAISQRINHKVRLIKGADPATGSKLRKRYSRRDDISDLITRLGPYAKNPPVEVVETLERRSTKEKGVLPLTFAGESLQTSVRREETVTVRLTQNQVARAVGSVLFKELGPPTDGEEKLRFIFVGGSDDSDLSAIEYTRTAVE
jgi:hypothetical protein